MGERLLPVRYRILDRMRWQKKGDQDEYTGFRCPLLCQCCPLKKADNLDTDEAIKLLEGVAEIHHLGEGFSKTRQTTEDNAVLLCADCHTLLHLNDPSSCRF